MPNNPLTNEQLAELDRLQMQRVLSKIIPEPNSGCWLWTGCVNHAGYPQARNLITRKNGTLSRWIYKTLVSTFSEELLVCHKCDNTNCVNPDHLFLGSMKDNMQDAIRKGRNYLLSRKTCKHGHPFSPENTIIESTGARRCKICRKAQSESRRKTPHGKEQCRKGHVLTPENTRISNGVRRCLDCRRVKWKKAYQAKRAKKQAAKRMRNGGK